MNENYIKYSKPIIFLATFCIDNQLALITSPFLITMINWISNISKSTNRRIGVWTIMNNIHN